MKRLKQERGGTGAGPGRRRIADKHGHVIGRVERAIAGALPALAEEAVGEIRVKAPERCEEHGTVLRCPEPGCDTRSQRTAFDHKAFAYLADRIMGKPTTRSENTLTVRFVQELSVLMIGAFHAVNHLDDADARAQAFAAELDALGADYGPALAAGAG